MAKFRFQDLEIWKMAIELGDKLFDIADMLEQKRLYRMTYSRLSITCHAGLRVSNRR